MFTSIASVKALESLPASLHCFFFTLLFVSISQAALFAFERYPGFRFLRAGNEVAGIIFGAISTLYSLVLAFVIIACWNDYEDLNKTIEAEADQLNGILAHSSELPPVLKQSIHTSMYNYCSDVIGKEWRMNEDDSVVSASAIPSLRMLLLRANPADKAEERVYNVLDTDLSNISDLRRERLGHSHSHIPATVWYILQLGSAAIILFSFVFRAPSAKLKRIYLLALSTSIALCMYLVYSLDHPFVHNQVSNRPYTMVMEELRNSEGNKISKK